MKVFKRKKLLLSILLVVALVGIGVTVALSFAQSNQVVNSFEVAEHSTEIEEQVKGLTKTVWVSNQKNSPAYIRIRFEVSPEEAVKTANVQISGYDWKKGDDGFWYYTRPVSGNSKTKEIVWKVINESFIAVDSFDVLVYEESCVATSSSETVTIAEMQKAFQNADGAVKQNQG